MRRIRRRVLIGLFALAGALTSFAGALTSPAQANFCHEADPVCEVEDVRCNLTGRCRW